MFNPYHFYYPLNAYPPWIINYLPQRQPQFFVPPRNLLLPPYRPQSIPIPEIINADERSQPNKDNNKSVIIETPVVEAKPQTINESADISKQKPVKNEGTRPGRWSIEEHNRFLEGSVIVILIAIEIYGKDWTKVEAHVKTRNRSQIRSHAQKYFNNKKNVPNLSSSSQKKDTSKEIARSNNKFEVKTIKDVGPKIHLMYLEEYM